MTSEHPIHPQTLALMQRCASPKEKIEAAWSDSVPRVRYRIPRRLLSEIPLVGSSALIRAIDERWRWLLGALQPVLQSTDEDERWPRCAPADVLTVDLAIVHSEEHPGWTLRLVEFQAFTSVLATAVLLRRGHARCWPELENQSPGDHQAFGEELAAIGRVVAVGADPVLLEHDPWQQSTSWDIEATAVLWGLPVVEPHQLGGERGECVVDHEGQRRRVGHILNRVVVHKTPNPSPVRQQLAGLNVTWHSHPAWYYRIHKGLLPQLDLPPNERCARADRWRSLGLRAEALVLKAEDSYGGQDVRLRITESDLRNLEQPQRWIVQPRYQPYGLLMANDGAALSAEIRCMVALPRQGSPWLMSRIARMSRGGKSNGSAMRGEHGEGVSLLYGPPGA